jgi:hypothetical protein
MRYRKPARERMASREMPHFAEGSSASLLVMRIGGIADLPVPVLPRDTLAWL